MRPKNAKKVQKAREELEKISDLIKQYKERINQLEEEKLHLLIDKEILEEN